MSQQAIKQDIKKCIIHTINPKLKICIGLVIRTLYNFTINNVDFIIHNKFNLDLFYNKNNKLVIKIIENEKTKIVSDFLTGSYFGSFDIDISNSTLIPFYNLTTSFLIYNSIKQKEAILINSQIKQYLITIYNFKKANSYYLFNLTK